MSIRKLVIIWLFSLHATAGRTEDDACVVVDMIFVIDGSESVGTEDFRKMKNWLVGITEELQGRYGDNLQLEVLQFSDRDPAYKNIPIEESTVFNIPFKLGECEGSSSCVKDGISEMSYLSSQTFLAYALKRVLEVEFPSSPRYNISKKIVVVLTDGGADDDDLLPERYAEAKIQNVTCFATGIGDYERFLPELRTVANGNVCDERVFLAKDFDELLNGKILDSIGKCISSTNFNWCPNGTSCMVGHGVAACQSQETSSTPEYSNSLEPPTSGTRTSTTTTTTTTTATTTTTTAAVAETSAAPATAKTSCSLTCGINAVCSKVEGTDRCECNSGFTGDGLNCTNIGNSTFNSCDLGSTCTAVNGGDVKNGSNGTDVRILARTLLSWNVSEEEIWWFSEWKRWRRYTFQWKKGVEEWHARRCPEHTSGLMNATAWQNLFGCFEVQVVECVHRHTHLCDTDAFNCTACCCTDGSYTEPDKPRERWKNETKRYQSRMETYQLLMRICDTADE